MKKLLKNLKFERVIMKFLNAITIQCFGGDKYNDTGSYIDYNYNNEVMMYNDEEETLIFIDDILTVLKMEYNRCIYDSIVKFINKPNCEITVYKDNVYESINIEEYERIIREDKIS